MVVSVLMFLLLEAIGLSVNVVFTGHTHAFCFQTPQHPLPLYIKIYTFKQHCSNKFSETKLLPLFEIEPARISHFVDLKYCLPFLKMTEI